MLDTWRRGSRAWWPQDDVQPRHSGRKRLRHPLHGPTEYAYTAFHPAEAPERALVVYADSSAAEGLAPPAAPGSPGGRRAR